MAAKRWHGQRPIRLARELAERVDELPEAERVRLMHALTTRNSQPSGGTAA